MRSAGLLVLLVLAFAAQTANWDRIFAGGGIYFVDADCYSRMTRVREVVAHPFTRISHHEFENYPDGADPHTTAPFDHLVALLAVLIAPFTANPIDSAGAWISPLLGLAAVLFLWWWSRRENLPFAFAGLLLIAISPIIAQAFKLGRPDHQSLTLFLLAAGIAAEISLWRNPSKAWAVFWGIAWGLALWVTLYEPLVLLLLLLVARPILLRKAAITKTWALAFGIAAGIFLISILLDGWRIHPQNPIVTEYFPRWSRQIGELSHLPPLSGQFPGWMGWLLPVLPLLLGWNFWKKQDRPAGLLLILLAATYGLAIWQLRWACYMALAAALALPFALTAIRSHTLAWTLFALSLLPIAAQWATLLHPGPQAKAAHDEMRTDYQLLRQAATALISPDKTPILAPWWLSPPLTYWSGQPCIAGSSHQSLPGIVDSSRFYLETEPQAAREILKKHAVQYVVAYEPDRVLGAASALLGRPPRADALGFILYREPHQAPPFLRLVYANAFFKIFEVTD